MLSTRVHSPNGILIGSAVFVVFTVVTSRQTDRPYYCDTERPHLCTLCLRCGLIIIAVFNPSDLYYLAFSALMLLVGQQEGIRPVKTDWWSADVVICLERGADLHVVQLMPLPLTHTHTHTPV